MAKVLILFLSLLSFSMPSWAEDLPPVPEGPLLLTSVQPEQLTADYWINRLPDPDRVLKTPEQMEEFNRNIHSMVPDRVNVFDMGTSKSGSAVRNQLELEFKTLRNRVLWDVNDKRISKSYFDGTLKPRFAFDRIPKKIKLKFAAATTATSVRSLPTDRKMLEEPGDVEFDQLQYSLIKTWTPVAIMHQSRGGDWVYIQAPYTRGWARARDLAVFPNRKQLQNYVESQFFLSVTGEGVPVYLDPFMRDFDQWASMGTILPYEEINDSYYRVLLPKRTGDGYVTFRKAYIPRQADVTQGFLPYTQRNVINQAFKLLGARYGWGGQYKGRDCSGFTHDVFLSLGVDLPRNSNDQIFAGTQLGHFESFQEAEKKEQIFSSATPGITLFRMPLHMMLYLGEVDGRHYIIHATWAERIGYEPALDEKNRINQVVVSDLSLNGNSYLGPLFHRITAASEVA